MKTTSKTVVANIDDEWEQFMKSSTNDYNEDGSDSDQELDSEEMGAPGMNGYHTGCNMRKASNPLDLTMMENASKQLLNMDDIPEASELYISTKSKIEFLNVPIDIKQLFWDVKVMPYNTRTNGVIKKQIKFNSINEEELREMEERLKCEEYYETQVIKSINNPHGRIKFKDVRKISVGISKKDIMSFRSKKKSAFYNCFVMILRIHIQGMFREYHVKIFNTGKIELPGMQTVEIHDLVLSTILEVIQPHISEPLFYQNCSSTILINSNFNCGFYINREALYYLLKNKYNIDAIYDPCSYPGIQCKLYYNEEEGLHIDFDKLMLGQPLTQDSAKLVKVSFMIFRTGSVLIVGRCHEDTLNNLYLYIKKLLKTEYGQIGQIIPIEDLLVKTQVKNKKIRKKVINITNDQGQGQDQHQDQEKAVELCI